MLLPLHELVRTTKPGRKPFEVGQIISNRLPSKPALRVKLGSKCCSREKETIHTADGVARNLRKQVRFAEAAPRARRGPQDQGTRLSAYGYGFRGIESTCISCAVYGLTVIAVTDVLQEGLTR